MSSLDHLARAGRGAAAAALALAVSACAFRPLYGPTASGAPMAETLAAIEIVPVSVSVGQERLSHYLRSELVFDLNGSGEPKPKRYRLTVNASQSLTTPLTDSTTGRADAATITGSANYTLALRDGGTVLTSGTAVGTATYDRNPQRFAAVRAARDAEIRLGKLLAEQIKIRLASFLATNPVP
jgi:LPS-assembly lipoprotein